uniref:NYN domain-containing protein n=1 Tax=Tetranychus urticae TaxID=32264 RepID=T1KGH1_TETUR
MGKPCAVFWDIENIDVPKGQTVDSIVDLIRSTIIKPYNLNEIFFFCVCDVHKLPANVGHSLIALDVDIVQAYNGVKDSADDKIMELMRKFVKFSGQDCTIILLSGDADYCDTLSYLKKLHNVSIHLVRLANSFSPKLDQIADYTFMLNNSVLKPIKSTGPPKYFISIQNYPLSAELIKDSPLTGILKSIKIEKSKRTKTNKCEVKQLTFIRIPNVSDSVDNSKFIKFCVACTAPTGSQCILSKKPSLWIVFSFKSHAQDCLSKVQILYPDAVISEPPPGLTLPCLISPYIVQFFDEQSILSNSPKLDVPSNTAVCTEIVLTLPCSDNVHSVKPSSINSLNNTSEIEHEIVQNTGEVETLFKVSQEKALDAHSISQVSQIFNIKSENSNIKDTIINPVEPSKPGSFVKHKLPVSSSVSQAKSNFKMFFHCESPVNTNLSTNWSLIYNLFEKSYDLGAKKVIFDRNIFCLHFDSEKNYQQMLVKKDSLDLRGLRVAHVESLEQKMANKMNCYPSDNPWCLSQELDLHCLLIKLDDQHHSYFIHQIKTLLEEWKSIFIKSLSEEIWIGFPDEVICEDSCRHILRLLRYPYKSVERAKPPTKLLESIVFDDLVGDAYDLAFLSNALHSSQKLDEKPQIFQVMTSLMETEQEPDKRWFYVQVKGLMYICSSCYPQLNLSQVIKLLVKFAKVIPIAGIASMTQVDFVFSSWVEAVTACHFINNLRNDDFCCQQPRVKASLVKKPDEWFTNREFYIINDQRKVLEKIIKTKNDFNEMDATSTMVTPVKDSKPWLGIYAPNSVIYPQCYLVISPKTGSKFTPSMISIIKMNLIEMGYKVIIEFEDKIWVEVEDLVKGNIAKVRIGNLEFKLLHENDKHDITIGVEVEERISYMDQVPLCVALMVSKRISGGKQIKNEKTSIVNGYYIHPYVPLGHFNYYHREAVGMKTKIYCNSNSFTCF